MFINTRGKTYSDVAPGVLYHVAKFNGRNGGKLRTIKKYFGRVDRNSRTYTNTDKNKMTGCFRYDTPRTTKQLCVSPNAGEMCNGSLWFPEENDDLALSIFEEKYGKPLRIVEA